MLDHPLLSAKEEAGLARRIKLGHREAAHELVRHNFRLAWVMAEEWTASSREGGAAAEDLFSAAITGLYKAAGKFRPTKGSFARYAAYFVRDALRAETGHAAVVRWRTGSAEDRRRAAMARWKWLERTGAEASDAEVAAILGWDEPRVARTSPRSRPVSLDAPSGNGTAPLSESISDPSVAAPDEYCASNDEMERVRSALGKLDERSREVIAQRFGFSRAGEKASLRAVGEDLGISGERVRQIERRALARLRVVLAGPLRLPATIPAEMKLDYLCRRDVGTLQAAIAPWAADSEAELCLTA